jgi:predicted enzyme related to lactoylglutathione lyase
LRRTVALCLPNKNSYCKSSLMKIRAIMLFVKDVKTVAAFYQNYFGLKPVGKFNPEYLELSGGGIRIALHRSPSHDGNSSHSPAKIIFACKDVPAMVKKLSAKGLKFGKIHSYEKIQFCDTKDPEKNPVQISSRT